MIKQYFLVGVGGMFGTIFRYITSAYFMHHYTNSKFPLGTFIVNLAGCLLIGLMAGITERMSVYNSEIRLAAITGFLGGFTTFSAFSLESLHLLKEGNLFLTLTYAAGSVIFGILFAYLGLKAAV